MDLSIEECSENAECAQELLENDSACLDIPLPSAPASSDCSPQPDVTPTPFDETSKTSDVCLSRTDEAVDELVSCASVSDPQPVQDEPQRELEAVEVEPELELELGQVELEREPEPGEVEPERELEQRELLLKPAHIDNVVDSEESSQFSTAAVDEDNNQDPAPQFVEHSDVCADDGIVPVCALRKATMAEIPLQHDIDICYTVSISAVLKLLGRW